MDSESVEVQITNSIVPCHSLNLDYVYIIHYFLGKVKHKKNPCKYKDLQGYNLCEIL